jgi:spore coat polysaccharide biosynthesis predicted glycosyltransferase SpsG
VSADVRVVLDPDDLPERMFQADFAVTTASTTTYELLALGTPIISLPVVDNQKLIAEALQEHAAATVLKDTAGVNAFSDAIGGYVSDRSLRRKRRETGRDLVDGRGVDRVLWKVLSAGDSD